MNIGDGYTSGGTTPQSKKTTIGTYRDAYNKKLESEIISRKPTEGSKPKDLLGIPWLLAFALKTDGWFLRSDIIWTKKNIKPESVTDRPSNCYEHVFLFSKTPKYYYDYRAVAVKKSTGGDDDKKRLRNVWLINNEPRRGSTHAASFPKKLAITCIQAGCPEEGTVLDPFLGSGTAALAARELNRKWVGIEISLEYCKEAEGRISNQKNRAKVKIKPKGDDSPFF